MVLFHTKDDGLTISVKGINHEVLMEELRTKAGISKGISFSVGRRLSNDELTQIANGTDKREYELAMDYLTQYTAPQLPLL